MKTEGPFSRYSDNLLNIFFCSLIIATLGQVAVVIEKIGDGAFAKGSFGIPNVVWIVNSALFSALLIWTFLLVKKERAARKRNDTSTS